MAILHIGLEKTATTYIQAFLHANQEALSEAGLRVFQMGASANHHALAAAVVNTDTRQDIHDWYSVTATTQKAFRERVTNAIEAQRVDGTDLVFSSEHLSSRVTRTSELEAVAKMVDMPGRGVAVIVYLRQQAFMAQSTYSTAIRSGWTYRFSAESVAGYRHRYEFLGILQLWEQLPRSTLIPRVFREDWKHEPVAMAKDFVDALGIGWSDAFALPDGLPNESLGAADLEILRVLNVRAGGDSTLEDLRRRFIRTSERARQGTPFRLSADELTSIQRAYRESNKALSRYLHPRDVEYLCRDLDGPKASMAPTDSDLAASLHRLVHLAHEAGRSTR